MESLDVRSQGLTNQVQVHSGQANPKKKKKKQIKIFSMNDILYEFCIFVDYALSSLFAYSDRSFQTKDMLLFFICINK